MNDVEYKKIIIRMFEYLIDFYDVDKAILILYELNKKRGQKL